MSESKLEQTRGKWKARGIITGLGKDGAYSSWTSPSGRDCRKIKFGIKTSENNFVYPELLGVKLDKVYAYNPNTKESKAFNFDDRENIPEGFKILECIINEDGDKNGYVGFDGTKNIYNNFNDGDSVFVSGEVRWQTFTGEQGEVTLQNFVIKYIRKLDEVDFENDKETAFFDQQLIIDSTEVDKETNKLYLDGYIINRGDEVISTANSNNKLVVDLESKEKLAKKLSKTNFGDYIHIYGRITNEVETVESDEVTDVEDDDWGSDEDPFENNMVNNVVRELRITGVKKDEDGNPIYKKKKYKEEDLFGEDDGNDGIDWDDTDEDPFGDIDDD